jgi:hypothetical protein
MVSRIDQLKNAGIIDDPDDLKDDAMKLINDLAEDEFNAILTARAKISDAAGRKLYDRAIQVQGF